MPLSTWIFLKTASDICGVGPDGAAAWPAAPANACFADSGIAVPGAIFRFEGIEVPLVANAMPVSHATVSAVTAKISPFDHFIDILLVVRPIRKYTRADLVLEVGGLDGNGAAQRRAHRGSRPPIYRP